ncbi:hypothetical protein Taro_001348 [Colocasia esculenta]|uniref:Uncharacterized protein n=1 Tax=Colocasia esculenta TaxID=4460 RepID=A0A843TIT8_COLES|nr:hypothetical protein [Colocasia esculenta]
MPQGRKGVVSAFLGGGFFLPEPGGGRRGRGARGEGDALPETLFPPPLFRTVSSETETVSVSALPETETDTLILEVCRGSDIWKFLTVGALQVLKNALELPLRFGWNGDPCVPQQHPWSGVDCQFDGKSGKWVIDGLIDIIRVLSKATLNWAKPYNPKGGLPLLWLCSGGRRLPIRGAMIR